jgi:SNF2 domain-containing protein
MKFDFRYDDQAAYLTVQPDKKGWLARFRKTSYLDLQALPKEERGAALAIARLRQLDPEGKLHSVGQGKITIGHQLAARLDARNASALGLPPLLSGVVFRARLVGTVGSADFRIEWWWERNGRPVSLPMKGAFVGPSTSSMRIPEQIYAAIKEADLISRDSSLADHWLALGRFRRLFDSGSELEGAALEGFLRDVTVVTCDSVGLAFEQDDDTRFYPLPFSSGAKSGDGTSGLEDALLRGAELERFRSDILARGVRPAFRVGEGKFLIVDPSAVPVVDTIIEYTRKDEAGRRAFIADAGRVISEAIELAMLRDGRITALMSPAARTEKVEGEASRAWIETDEWVSRVIGVAKWEATAIDGIQESGTAWLQQVPDAELGEKLATILDEELAFVIMALEDARRRGDTSISHEVGELPAIEVVIEALKRRLAEFLRQKELDEPGVKLDAYLPITHDNFWEIDFKAASRRRKEKLEPDKPEAVRTRLQHHQSVSLEWQIAAWKAGTPGVLNADEQGLGKTLQTLAFISWLKTHMSIGDLPAKPFLVVAPTSLLLNWEAEIEQHLEPGFLGKPVRLYGEHLSRFKKPEANGQDLREGEAQLDLDAILQLEEGSPIIITTYQTLANYAISLMDLPCALAVFDEIQFVKNPVTMRAKAAKAVRADFKIGLTGTPIENATKDLWALMDQLFPGALGALAQFRRIFDVPTEEGMAALHGALFKSQSGQPPLALRRLKIDAAPNLPPKVRVLHPREMPSAQALRYEEARAKGGMMLALLHHIRRVSLHPGLLEGETTEEFNTSSARVAAAVDILRHVKSKGERALVFVENRDVQAWFAEVVRLEFDLERVMIINGDTTVDARKDITDRFQRHLVEDGGFDVLVLGPRAAGTGLTLTAANHVIHLSRWWNPAVEEQCNDRTHRIGQTKPVTVHIPLAVHPGLGPGSFDCLLQRLMKRKRSLAERILWPAEATEGETRLLYDGVLAAGTGPEESTKANIEEHIEGRADLITEVISENSIRLRMRRGGASIVVSSEAVLPHCDVGAGGDAVLITMNARSGATPQKLPHSRLTTTSLWPDYILPD